MTANATTVLTWLVRRAGIPLDATIWVPETGTVDEAKAEARREHGANAQAVRRLGDQYWTELELC
ncbi:hypothetical protein ACT17_11385 [Mycolicibacterium conceptionense]|jgi:hypothetical protein|uniref:Uncharacterized protein n=1 Tax=Mycolicibacterium conceptionense TaxID=451644 RepID=A0A0J8UA30_9MYCO|nr:MULTISPECIES: hypothetical protein [Mycobacteriaceae]KMV18246.1 hypothetical protein ACT17_11385 [Mycolicibacterium conceptionense]OBF76562.1 hypothetical protein A5751_23875 [Mycolicibacterium fortuitum]TMS50258.1 hypothetical protein E0T84_24610 [Mycobacterium sp. DBP42]